METKLLEIRDRGTFIPALAIRLSGDDGYLARRAGFGFQLVILIHLETMESQYEPHNWKSVARTMPAAHSWLEKHWNEAASESVIDVQFILGETDLPKHSERLDEPGHTDMPRARHA